MLEIEGRATAETTDLARFILERRGGRRQDQLARRAGIRSSTLCKIEKGIIRRPSDRSIAGLAHALGVPAERLFELRDHGPREETVRSVVAMLESGAIEGEVLFAGIRPRRLHIVGASRKDPPIDVLLTYGARKR